MEMKCGWGEVALSWIGWSGIDEILIRQDAVRTLSSVPSYVSCSIVQQGSSRIIDGLWVQAYRPLRNRLDLAPHELLQLIRALRIRRRLVVVPAAIIEDELRIFDEVLRCRVQVLLMLLLHRAEVHGLLDDLVIIRHLVPVDGLREGPRRAVVLHVVEQVQQLVVIGAVPRLPRELVHVRRPAGVLDGGDGHRVDFREGAGPGGGFPFLGRGVHDVGFGKGSDLGVDGFFLLQQHAAGLEVADLGHHGALHDGAAFVIFDVAHPPRLLERDLLGEALLFEVADRVIVGVGEEVHDIRGRLDVVFQVRHQVRAVAFHLLVGRDGAEDDLSELSAFEGSVCYTPVRIVSIPSLTHTIGCMGHTRQPPTAS